MGGREFNLIEGTTLGKGGFVFNFLKKSLF